jgi:nucleotide-binding universal stress UspA family protein
MNSYSIQRILVPVDLSETSLNALETAVSIAKTHSASLCILHVTEPVPGNEINHLNLPSQANTDVLTALTDAIRYTGDLRPRLLQKSGHVVESIINTASDEQCNLVIMGTHGASGLREGFIGSNTYNAIKYATCPVLTIPPLQKFISFKKVLFPIRPVKGALIRYDIACNFLSANSTLQVLGLSYLRMERDTGLLDNIVEEIKDHLKSGQVEVNTSWGRGSSVSDDIIQFINLHAPDLIVLTSILDVITKPNFVGPHTQRLIHASRVPVLNIKRITNPAFA